MNTRQAAQMPLTPALGLRLAICTRNRANPGSMRFATVFARLGSQERLVRGVAGGVSQEACESYAGK